MQRSKFFNPKGCTSPEGIVKVLSSIVKSNVGHCNS